MELVSPAESTIAPSLTDLIGADSKKKFASFFFLISANTAVTLLDPISNAQI
jgi:hypothetical protein